MMNQKPRAKKGTFGRILKFLFKSYEVICGLGIIQSLL